MSKHRSGGKVLMAVSDYDPAEKLPWILKAYAARCVKRDWSDATGVDHEWASALALCIDKFAKDWVAANCSGRD